MFLRRLRHAHVILLLLTIVIGLGVYEIINNYNGRPVYVPIHNISHMYKYPYRTLSQNDYSRLIDIQDFKFVLLSEQCSFWDDTTLLLVLIHSAPKHFAERITIRETWGQENSLMKMVFMIGAVKNPKVQHKLLAEKKQFGDITQGSFVDTYRNLTYKHIMVFKYAIYHCPLARYILKTDDDTFINMPALVPFLASKVSFYGARGLLMCRLRKNEHPMRLRDYKWWVSFDEYPEKRYPPLCPGFSVLYSQDVLFMLYRAAQNSSFFRIDDVHITGMLFQSIGSGLLQHTDVDSYVLTAREREEIMNDSNYNLGHDFFFGGPDLTEDVIRRLHDFTLKPDPILRTVL